MCQPDPGTGLNAGKGGEVVFGVLSPVYGLLAELRLLLYCRARLDTWKQH